MDGNITGNMTVADVRNLAMQIGVLMIPMIGLTAVLVQAAWRRFGKKVGTLKLGRMVVASAVGMVFVILVVFIPLFFLTSLRPDFGSGDLSLFQATGYGGVAMILGWLIWFLVRSPESKLWGKEEEALIIVPKCRQRASTLWPTLFGVVGCSFLVVAALSELVALTLVSSSAFGREFGHEILDQGRWFAWNGICCLLSGVVVVTLGYVSDYLLSPEVDK